MYCVTISQIEMLKKAYIYAITPREEASDSHLLRVEVTPRVEVARLGLELRIEVR